LFVCQVVLRKKLKKFSAPGRPGAYPTLAFVIMISATMRNKTCISHLKDFVLPSLRPPTLSRVVCCLWSTVLYTECSSYRTTCVPTSTALRVCGE
jgi:hypothetical protein